MLIPAAWVAVCAFLAFMDGIDFESLWLFIAGCVLSAGSVVLAKVMP